METAPCVKRSNKSLHSLAQCFPPIESIYALTNEQRLLMKSDYATTEPYATPVPFHYPKLPHLSNSLHWANTDQHIVPSISTPTSINGGGGQEFTSLMAMDPYKIQRMDFKCQTPQPMAWSQWSPEPEPELASEFNGTYLPIQYNECLSPPDEYSEDENDDENPNCPPQSNVPNNHQLTSHPPPQDTWLDGGILPPDPQNGGGDHHKPRYPDRPRSSRRRIPTIAQRRAANVRERKRMLSLNTAFDQLRKFVPTFAYEKHLSRIETLRLAIGYIGFMRNILESPQDLMYSKYARAAEEVAIKWSTQV